MVELHACGYESQIFVGHIASIFGKVKFYRTPIHCNTEISRTPLDRKKKKSHPCKKTN